MNANNDNKYFFLKGYSKFAVSRAEDLINLHKEVNCRGDMDFLGLGQYINDFFVNQRSIILFERNPLLLKNKINNIILDQVSLVCGKRFKIVGASSTTEINNLFIPKLKYVTVFQKINESIVSNLYHTLTYYRFNNKIISEKYSKNIEFQKLVYKYSTSNINLEELETDLYDCKTLLNLYIRDWIICTTKDVSFYKANTSFNESILWVNFESLKSQKVRELKRIHKFLGLDPNLLHNKDGFGNGAQDYDYSYQSKFNKESFRKLIGDQWINILEDLETQAIDYSKVNH